MESNWLTAAQAPDEGRAVAGKCGSSRPKADNECSQRAAPLPGGCPIAENQELATWNSRTEVANGVHDV